LYAGVAWGSFANPGAIIQGTIPFTLLGWICFFVPLIVIVDSNNGLFRLPLFTLVGGLGGLLAFLALVAWWLPLLEHSYAYLIHPAITGMVAATVYAAAVSKESNNAGQHSPIVTKGSRG
jgi:hypothetical protein